MGTSAEDLDAGIIDRAVGRWIRSKDTFDSLRQMDLLPDVVHAGVKLVSAGEGLRELLERTSFTPRERTYAIDRWRARSWSFSDTLRARVVVGDLSYAVDLVSAGRALADLLTALPAQEPPPAPPEDPLVAEIRKELWAPGRLPTPETVAALVRTVAKTALDANFALTFFAKAATDINDAERRFLQDMVCELARAKVKYPDPRRRFAALVSEVGEVATAFLRETPERVREEAVQVAVVAMRIATEGDPTQEER